MRGASAKPSSQAGIWVWEDAGDSTVTGLQAPPSGSRKSEGGLGFVLVRIFICNVT